MAMAAAASGFGSMAGGMFTPAGMAGAGQAMGGGGNLMGGAGNLLGSIGGIIQGKKNRELTRELFNKGVKVHFADRALNYAIYRRQFEDYKAMQNRNYSGGNFYRMGHPPGYPVNMRNYGWLGLQ